MLNDLFLWTSHALPHGGSNALAGAGLFLCACIILGGWTHECTRIRWVAAFRRSDTHDLPTTD